MASCSFLARPLSIFFQLGSFRLCENGQTNLLWPTKRDRFCIDKMGQCHLARGVEVSEPKGALTCEFKLHTRRSSQRSC
jgi:hypothetical protein